MTWVAVNAGVSELFLFLCFSRLAERQMARLKQQYLRSVLRQELAWHDLQGNTSVSSRISTHLPRLKAVYGLPLAHSIAFASKALVSFVIGMSASWQLMLTLLTMVPVIWVSFKAFGRLRDQNGIRSARAYLQASRVTDEIVSLLYTIRAFCSFKEELDRFAIIDQWHQLPEFKGMRKKYKKPAKQSGASTT
jgi:ATP-binding cassette subfamily B (MDR/TAP) protein 1